MHEPTMNQRGSDRPARRHLALTAAAAVALGHLGCGEPEQEGGAVAGTDSALYGRTSYESSAERYVDPFTAAHLERAMFYARTISNSTAFRQCVANTMNAMYMNCADPAASSTRAGQIDDAWRSFRYTDNGMSFGLRPQSDAPSAGASARNETGDPFGTHHITVYDGYTKAFDWSGFTGVQPWGWRVSDMIHEYMHTLGYNHMDDEVSKNACAGRNGRSSYYALGEPSAPYNYGWCGAAVLGESQRQCGDVRTGCATGSLQVIANWTGTNERLPQPTTSCVCLADPRHEIALRTASGWTVMADGGGGSTVSSHASTAVGAWQLFQLYDPVGTQLVSGDSVALKTFVGPFLRQASDGTFPADGASPSWFTMGMVGASTGAAVGNGSTVTLSRGSSYVRDDGTTLRATTSSTDAATRFTLLEPRRDHLVYLRSRMTGKYVNVDVTDIGKAWLNRTAAKLAGTDRQLQASSAFWLIDWNGGVLEAGDTVSFEHFENDGRHFLSVVDGDNVQARVVNAVGTYERFTVSKIDGTSGPIRHDDRVYLRTARGTYLTSALSQLQSYGTYVGAYREFNLRLVEQHDRSRPTW